MWSVSVLQIYNQKYFLPSVFDSFLNMLLRMQAKRNTLKMRMLHLMQQNSLAENAANSEYEMIL